MRNDSSPGRREGALRTGVHMQPAWGRWRRLHAPRMMQLPMRNDTVTDDYSTQSCPFSVPKDATSYIGRLSLLKLLPKPSLISLLEQPSRNLSRPQVEKLRHRIISLQAVVGRAHEVQGGCLTSPHMHAQCLRSCSHQTYLPCHSLNVLQGCDPRFFPFCPVT